MQVQILTWQFSVKRIRPSSEELIKKYNAIAHQWQQKIQQFGYDRVYTSLFAGLHDVLHNHFARHSTISVLDCGVGSGALSVALYKSEHENLTLQGVDTSPAMASAARKHLAQQKIPMQIQIQDKTYAACRMTTTYSAW